MSLYPVPSSRRHKMEDDVSQFMKESSRSYQECKVKNAARKTSLQKKERGIETERRLASAQLTREEKQLREQLKQMKIEKMKHSLINNMRDNAKREVIEEPPQDVVLPTDPYPITFSKDHRSPSPFRKEYTGKSRSNSPMSPATRSKHTDEREFKQRNRKQRKISAEFEDLHLHVESGTFHKAKLTSKRQQSAQLSSRVSPTLLSHTHTRQFGSPQLLKRDFHSNHTSRSSLSADSGSNISSLEDLHWVGDPEAIHSVRRLQRTTEEQEFDHEIHKLTSHSSAKHNVYLDY
ncbi:hypothetical protein ScPMuIL_012791 [Solemya velum]